MVRTRYWHINGWRAVLLAPIAVPVGLILNLLPLKKAVDLSGADVAGYLRDFLEGKSGEWDWDDFECVPIADPALDKIRKAAALAGPPDPDIPKLRQLLQEAERLAGMSLTHSAAGTPAPTG